VVPEEPRAWRLVGAAAGITVLAEGIALSSLKGSSQTSYEAALLVLGLIAAIPFAIAAIRPSILGRYLRMPALIGAVIGLDVMLIGANLSFSGDRALRLGMESQPVYVVAIFCALVFFAGVALLVASLISEKKLNLFALLAYGGGAAAAAEGLVVVGIAAQTYIQGIGTVMESTIQLLGVLLFAVAMVFVVVSIVAEWIRKGVAVLTLLRSASAALLVIAGIALTALATPITIKGIGGIMETTVMLGGLQLAVLGLFTLAMCSLSASPESAKMRRLALFATVFLALLVPMAALSAGNVL
jgi:hypothetical protein